MGYYFKRMDNLIDSYHRLGEEPIILNTKNVNLYLPPTFFKQYIKYISLTNL